MTAGDNNSFAHFCFFFFYHSSCLFKGSSIEIKNELEKQNLKNSSQRTEREVKMMGRGDED